MSTSQDRDKKILEQVRDIMRLNHYSIHTERSYCDWIKRYISFHKMKSRADLKEGELKIEQFLTHIAVHENVSPSTQNQAMNALVFLYKKVLEQPLDKKIDAIRAKTKKNIPVVMSRDEVSNVISFMNGTPQLVTKLLYGSGLRIAEAIRLRVLDIDFSLKGIVVRSGKGNKDRVTTLPVSVSRILLHHLEGVKLLHEQDLSNGFGAVYLPYALERKYSKASKEWQWQYVFPSKNFSTDPRTGKVRRHHIDPSPINRAIKSAAKKAEINKKISAHTFSYPNLNKIQTFFIDT
jgi:integron integrase